MRRFKLSLGYLLIGLAALVYLVSVGAALSQLGCMSWKGQALLSDAFHAAARAADAHGDPVRKAQIEACEDASLAAVRAATDAQQALFDESPDYAKKDAIARAAVSKRDTTCAAAGVKAGVKVSAATAVHADGGLVPDAGPAVVAPVAPAPIAAPAAPAPVVAPAVAPAPTPPPPDGGH